MKNHFKDFLISVLMMLGVTAFISGGFIIASVLFAVTAITSIVYRSKPTKQAKKP